MEVLLEKWLEKEKLSEKDIIYLWNKNHKK